MRTFDKNMKVIRHQTVGMKPVRVAGGAFEQQRKNNVSGGFLAEIGRTMVTANGDEIGFATEVVFRRKAGELVEGGHSEEGYTERGMGKRREGVYWVEFRQGWRGRAVVGQWRKGRGVRDRIT